MNLRECLQLAKDAGFEGIELNYDLDNDLSPIRLTHSPSGGGANAALRTTNPAGDFQFLVPKPEVMKEYGFKVRTGLRPRCSRDEVRAEYRKCNAAK